MTILYGLLALGIIVFVHELGHFFAAKICGVTVESFSIGMGPVLFHKTINKTDWRISLIPLGGYCGMKGQEDLQLTKDGEDNRQNTEKDSFYGVSSLKRIFIAFCGPFFNILFASFSFMIISMIGFTNYSNESKIILADELYPEIHSPAKDAGLKTGDKIIKINDKEINYFFDITQNVSIHPDEILKITVERENKIMVFDVNTDMDKSTGAGKIGVVNWISPLVKEIVDTSNIYSTPLQKGDYITHIDGIKVNNTVDIQKAINNKSQIIVDFLRNQKPYSTVIYIDETNANNLGIIFNYDEIKTPGLNIFKAFVKGWQETLNMIGLTFKSLGLLFKGVDLTEAVSGPLRITVMLGDTAKAGFSEGFSVGIVSILNFLSLISVSLFIMNLLPIPILDGGLILFAFIETIIKRPISAKVQYYVQFIGIAFIAFLFIFAMFGDIKYLLKFWR